MKRYLFVLLVGSLAIASCSDDDNVPPSNFEIIIDELTRFSATISWSESVDENDDTVTYSVFLNDTLVEDNLLDLSFNFTELDEDTTYDGEIVSSDGVNNTSVSFNFTTLNKNNDDVNDPPSVFDIMVSNISNNSALLSWDDSMDPENENILYNLYVDDLLIEENIENTTFLLSDLSAGTSYEGRIAATDGVNTTDITFNFITLEFNIYVENLTPHSASISWSDLTSQQNDEVTYTVYLNNQILEKNIDNTMYFIGGLSQETFYEGEVIANFGGIVVSSSFSFTTLVFNTVVMNITNHSFSVSWSDLASQQDDEVTYTVYLNNQILEKNIENTIYSIGELSQETSYEGEVIANIGGTDASSSFSFTTTGITCTLPSNIEDGLLAYYPFSNGNLDDNYNSNNLTNINQSIPTTDRAGSFNCAFEFETGRYLTTQNSNFLNNLDSFSISVWVNPSELTNFHSIIHRNDTGLNCPNRSGEWSLGFYDCGRPVFGHDASVWGLWMGDTCDDSIDFYTNNWYHLTAIKDNDTYKIYYNGILQEIDVGSADCGEAEDVGDLFIGFITGKVDDIMIHGRALSDNEVLEVYNLEPCCD